MTATIIFVFLFTILSASNPVKPQENSAVNYDASLSFEWTGPMSMRVRNRDGDEDDIQLRPAQGIGNVHVDCLFVGYLLNDTDGSAGVVGCRDCKEVSIVIVWRYSAGTMFTLRTENKTTVELLDNSAINEDYESDEEEFIRSKRSSYYDEDDIYDYDYGDYSYDGGDTIPPNVYYEFALSYDDAFFTHMNQNTTEAEEYLTIVATLAQVYFKHPSLGTVIHFVINKNIRYLQEKEFKVDPWSKDTYIDPKTKLPTPKLGIRQARTIQSTQPLIIFTRTDELEKWRGVAAKRKGCNETLGRAIVKHREEKQRAAITMAHEMGHWYGNLHDGKVDEKNSNKLIEDRTSCQDQGIMTDSMNRPEKWSNCSRTRLEKWFTNTGYACLKTAPACDNNAWDKNVPCTCGVGAKSNLCSNQDKGYCIHERGTCIDGELVRDTRAQIPDFLFNCLAKRDPWIEPCRPFREYLMIFDSQGNFFQEMTNTNDNSKFLGTSSTKKARKPIGWQRLEDNFQCCDYLFELEIVDQKAGSFFIATASGQLLVAGIEENPSLMLRKDHCSQGKNEYELNIYSVTSTTPNSVITPAPDYGCDQAYWHLWKVEDRYLLIESVTKPGLFLNVESASHKVRLGIEEKMTGIYTSFLSHITLERTDGLAEPGIEDEAYGDVVVHYFDRDGRQQSGYVCDHDWNPESAQSVCKLLWYDTGLPTYDGRYSNTKTPEYAVSGLECNNENLGECQIKTICEHNGFSCLSQKSMKEFGGEGYGCNRGSATDVAGVVCGNQTQIDNLLKQEHTCNRSFIVATDRQSVSAMLSIQKQIKTVAVSMFGYKHWSEYLLSKPMAVSLMSELLLVSSQKDLEVELIKPEIEDWIHLKHFYLQPNILLLYHHIHDNFKLSTDNMGLITVNTREFHRNMKMAVGNAFSSSRYDYKIGLPRNLERMAKYAETNKKMITEVCAAFRNTTEIILELFQALQQTRGYQQNKMVNTEKTLFMLNTTYENDKKEYQEQMILKQEYDAAVKTSRKSYLDAIKDGVTECNNCQWIDNIWKSFNNVADIMLKIQNSVLNEDNSYSEVTGVIEDLVAQVAIIEKDTKSSKSNQQITPFIVSQDERFKQEYIKNRFIGTMLKLTKLSVNMKIDILSQLSVPIAKKSNDYALEIKEFLENLITRNVRKVSEMTEEEIRALTTLLTKGKAILTEATNLQAKYELEIDMSFIHDDHKTGAQAAIFLENLISQYNTGKIIKTLCNRMSIAKREMVKQDLEKTRSRYETIVACSRFLSKFLQQWRESEAFFRNLSDNLEIIQLMIRLGYMSEHFLDIGVNIQRNQLQKQFINALEGEVIGVLAYNNYIGWLANFYTKIAQDSLLHPMASIGKHLEKIEDPVEYQKMVKSIEDEMLTIQEYIKSIVSKEEAVMSDKITKDIYEIKNELACNLEDANLTITANPIGNILDIDEDYDLF